jgi:hypothetical protein
MVDYASNNTFEPYPNLNSSKGYPGIRLIAPENYSHALMEIIKPILNKEFDIPDHLEMRRKGCVMSLITVKPENLGPLQATPHFDTSDFNHFAILLYLCNETHGGTAFYRHRATGLEIIKPETSDQYLDTYYAELNERRPLQKYFDDSNERFTKIAMVQARFNRMVIYRGCMLHTPYINPEHSINAEPKAGRLTVNSFVVF